MATQQIPVGRAIGIGEVARSGPITTGWQAFEPTSPEDIGPATFDAMRRTDETIKAGIQILKLSVLSRVGAYEHDDEGIADYVSESLRRMQGTVRGVLSELMSAIWAGFAVAEIVWDRIPDGRFQGKVYPRKIKTLHPASLHPQGLVNDGKGNVEKVIQNKGSANEIELPFGKFIHWAYDGGGGTFDSPYGVSALRSAHRYWFMKGLALVSWGIFLERYAIPIMLGYAGEGKTRNPLTGAEQEETEVLMQMMHAVRTVTHMVLLRGRNPETGEYEDIEKGVPNVRFLEPRRQAGEVYEPFVRHADVGIFRSLLLPSLMFAEAEFGTRAQAGTHLDAFIMLQDSLLADLCEGILLEKLIRPMLDLNFPGLDDYGKWTPEELTVEDAKTGAEIIRMLADAGAIDPVGDKPLQEHIRQKYFPELAEEVPPEGGVEELVQQAVEASRRRAAGKRKEVA